MVDVRVEELVQLARERSALSRQRLVENITDLFLTEEWRLSEHERALMNDILAKLVEEVETAVRKQLAEILAKSSIDLPDVERILAHDEIGVARPILRHSRTLKDPELIEIIRQRTDEHRLTIALRDELSESVSDALVEHGNEDVIEALLRNADAQISERAMEYLVAESRRVDRFQEPLVSRADLPPHLACRMFWWVSAALRRQLLSQLKVHEVALDRAIADAAEMLEAEQRELTSIHAKAQRLVRRMHEIGDLTIEFLLACLRHRRLAVFVAGLAELAGIDLRTAWRIFGDPGGESFAVLAKVAGMDRRQFTAAFLLILEARSGSRARSPQVLERIAELFDKTSEEAARAALFYWQTDETYGEALEELRDVG